MKNLSELLNTFPIKAKHKNFGSIEVFGVRKQSNVSNNLMYYTKINGDYIWGRWDFGERIFNLLLKPNRRTELDYTTLAPLA